VPKTAAGPPYATAAPPATAEPGRRAAPQNDPKSAPRGEHSLPALGGGGSSGEPRQPPQGPPAQPPPRWPRPRWGGHQSRKMTPKARQEESTAYQTWWLGVEQWGAPKTSAEPPRATAAPLVAPAPGWRAAPQNDSKCAPRGEHSLTALGGGRRATESANNRRRPPPRSHRPAGRGRAGAAPSAAKRRKRSATKRAQPTSSGGGRGSNGG